MAVCWMCSMAFQIITVHGNSSDDSAAIPGASDRAEVPSWEIVLVDQDARFAVQVRQLRMPRLAIMGKIASSDRQRRLGKSVARLAGHFRPLTAYCVLVDWFEWHAAVEFSAIINK